MYNHEINRFRQLNRKKSENKISLLIIYMLVWISYSIYVVFLRSCVYYVAITFKRSDEYILQFLKNLYSNEIDKYKC